MAFWGRQSYRSQNQIRACQVIGIGVEGDNKGEPGHFSGVRELFYILVVLVVMWLQTFIKTQKLN